MTTYTERANDYLTSMMDVFNGIAAEDFAWDLTQRRYPNYDEDTQREVYDQIYSNDEELRETVKKNRVAQLADLASSLFDTDNPYHEADVVSARLDLAFAAKYGKTSNDYIDTFVAGVPVEYIFA
jgi:hypothetical protein